MLPARIGLVSQSAAVDFKSLVNVANALNLQASRDVAPIWGINASVAAIPNATSLNPGVWPIYIVDDLPDGVGGFHQTENNQPFAFVLAGPSWSVSASHECLEMLVDPSGNRLVAAPAIEIQDNQVVEAPGKFEYLVEVCDPSESADCAYLIDEVLVSDFYTPRYFDPVAATGVRYSFTGKLTAPRQVLPDGYLSWTNPATGQLQQLRRFGAPQIVDLPSQTSGVGIPPSRTRSLRAIVDYYTRPPQRLDALRRSDPAMERREARTTALLASAAYHATAYATPGAAMLVVPPAPPAPKEVIDRNLELFRKPGALSVRPGYRHVGGTLTHQRAIVVKADPASVLDLNAMLPVEVEGVPVEVRAADPLYQARASETEQLVQAADARHELRPPEFPDEVFVSGNSQETVNALMAARPAKPQVDGGYKAPDGVTLDEVTEEVTLLLHISPDAGWKCLSEFLANVQNRLTVGMYDFTSAHILAAVKTDLAGKDLTLTLDHPAPNPSRDQTDDQTVADLQQALGDHFEGAWALVKSSRKAPQWLFPTAYHIKVAVREGGAFWLSTGNWNNSNQPEIDTSDLANARRIAENSDRDWHVIATSPTLARVFEVYLKNDYAVAHRVEEGVEALAAAGMAMPAPEVKLPDSVVPLVEAAGRAPAQFFDPLTVSGSIRIQPLLTPDNYQPHILKLIQSAQRSLYMQTQYIHPSDKPEDAGHQALISAIQDRIQAGVDVRLITSQYETTDWIEKLKDAGLDTSVLRIQPRVHNKGIVVDSAAAVVSSQNWSGDGTLRNRDAGLIMWDVRVAAYFEKVFLHDWNNLATAV